MEHPTYKCLADLACEIAAMREEIKMLQVRYQMVTEVIDSFVKLPEGTHLDWGNLEKGHQGGATAPDAQAAG